MKWKYPLMKMEEYMQKQERGRIYDPWIRTHLLAGAKMLHFCNKSMHVSGDIAFWEQYTGRQITSSSPILIEGTLNPINIDFINNFGEYNEENIWVVYSNNDQ